MKILKLQYKDFLVYMYIQKIFLSNSTQNSVTSFAGARNSQKNTAEKSTSIAQRIFKLLLTSGVYTAFANIEVIFRIYLSFMLTNCSGEQLFSQLARIENVKRSTLSQDRLGVLALLCFERELLHKTDFSSVINELIG